MKWYAVKVMMVLCMGAGAVRGESSRLVNEGVVDAPVADVWRAFTTKSGLESWMVPHAEFELRVGGKMRTNYHADGRIGDPNTIENAILSFEFERMLSLKATKAPEGFPFKNAMKNTWSVMYFEELGPRRTRIRVVGMGYGVDEESMKMRAFFDKGNAWTIAKLQEKLSPNTKTSSESHDKAFELLKRWVGGEWIHESTRENGTVFRVRNVITLGPGGKTLVGNSWLGGADGLYYHGHTQIWRDPKNGELRYQNMDEKGAMARGAIRMVGENALVWDWDVESPGAKATHYQVKTIFNGSDKYRMKLLQRNESGDGFQELFDIDFDRVASMPERFKKLRAEVLVPHRTD